MTRPTEHGKAHRRSFDDVLQEARLSRGQLQIWILSALGIALDGFDFFIIGAAMPLLKHGEWDPSPAELGGIGAAALVGAVVGALFIAPLTDRFGRRLIYILDPVIFVVTSIAAALAWDIWSLMAFRFLLGVGIGADYPISASYVSEAMPTRHRGRLVASTIGFQAVGMLVGVGVGLAMVMVLDDVSAWRWMVGFGAVPAAVLFVYRLRVPESPRWLVAQGEKTRAKHAFSLITGIPKSKLSLDLFEPPEATQRKAGGFKELFSKRIIRRTLLSTVPWFLMDIATYGVGVFTPTILAALHLGQHGLSSSHSSPLIANEIVALEGSGFVDLFLVVGFGLAIWLIDRLGRIRLQIVGFLGMFGSLVLLALAGADDPNVLLVFVGFILFNTMMNMGPNSTTYVLPSELFPTRLRARGHGFSSASGKIGAAVGIFLLPTLHAAIGLTWTLLLIAGAQLLGAIVTWIFSIETAGRHLEEFE